MASPPIELDDKTAIEMTEGKNVAIPEVDTAPQAVSKPKEDSSESSWKMRLPTPVWEAVILTPAILLIIGLFLLPTVYYALPAQQVRPENLLCY